MFLRDFSLVLIDAENEFYTSAYRTPSVIDNIVQALNLASNTNSDVFLTKYKNDSILEDVTNVVCDISKVTILEKDNEDASKVLQKSLNKQHLIIICGFNTNHCVKNTVLSLAKDGYDLLVLKDCCDDINDISHYFGLNEIYLNKIDICNIGDISGKY